MPILRELLGLDAPEIARTRSRLEVRFLRLCRAEGLPMPEVNAVVGSFEVDMSWPGTNVIVELDGWEFHSGRRSFERDRAKWADLTAAGHRVIVVTDRRLTRERSKLAATLGALLD